MYDVNDDREEAKVENFARMVEAQRFEAEMQEREFRREEKALRKAEKTRSIDNRTELSDDFERTARINNMRRYSIGNPNTPSRRQQDAYYRQQTGPQVVASQPVVIGNNYSNSRPAYVV